MTPRTADNSRAVVAKALTRVERLATLPEIAVRVMEVVDDLNGTADDLYEVLRCDPVLSAKVLRVVNSAFYGLPRQVADLERAIVLLGQSVIKNIAVAASLVRFFTGSEITDRFDPKQLWKHSIAVGVAARAMNAAGGNAIAPDEVFLAGLLHDLGLLGEQQAFPEAMNEILHLCYARGVNFLQLEREIIGATHEEFGEALTTRWCFPPSLCAAVACHHDPQSLPEELRPLGATLHCADILCCQERIGFSLTAREPRITPELLQEIGITEQQLPAIRKTLAVEYVRAEAVLGNGD